MLISMIDAGGIRPGNTYDENGQLYYVISFNHNKTGRGGAVVKLKVKNLMTGAITEKSFTPKDKLQEARIEQHPMQYLYKSGDFFVFMNQENFEQIELTADMLGDAVNFLTDNIVFDISFYLEKPIAASAPIHMVYEVTYAEPGLKGDTVSGATKPATIANGLSVQVPLFVNIGDKIKIDTRDCSYIERA